MRCDVAYADETSTGSTLARDLAAAKTLYIQLRDHFIGLSNLYAEQRVKWDHLDRTTRRVGKETESVYRHSKSKGKYIQVSRDQSDTLLCSAISSVNLPAYAFARVNFLHYRGPQEHHSCVS
jgi:hypothetical protein